VETAHLYKNGHFKCVWAHGPVILELYDRLTS